MNKNNFIVWKCAKHNLISILQGRSIIHVSNNAILLLENSITQITGLPGTSFLLISTIAKCILCDKDKQEYKQIGNRPRDGDFGACFMRPDEVCDISKTKIFCARPGLRLWECEMEGNVLKTHQLKNAIPSMEVTNIAELMTHSKQKLNKKTDNNLQFEKKSNHLDVISKQDGHDIIDSSIKHQQPKQFSKLLNFNSQSRYIISFQDNNIYVFDTKYSSIAITISDIHDIQSISLVDFSTMIIYTKQMECYFLKFTTIDNYLMELLEQQNYIDSCTLIKSNLDYIKNKLKSMPNALMQLKNLRDILQKLNRSDMLKEIDDICVNFENDLKVKSGMNGSGGILIVNSFKYGKKSLKTSSSSGENDDEEYPKICPNDAGIVVKTNQKQIVENMQAENRENFDDSADQKEIWNLYMIFKSGLISGTNFKDRYKDIFDKYKINEVIKLIKKFQIIMKENDEKSEYCINIFFDYLKPEIIWEIDVASRTFIATAFSEINQRPTNLKCLRCSFPLTIDETCVYPEIGRTLLQYFWSRSEYEKCLELASQVSYLIRDISKFYIQDRSFDKLIEFSFIVGDSIIIRRALESFGCETNTENLIQLWRKCFQFVHAIHSSEQNEYYCLKCQQFVPIATDIVNNDEDNLATKVPWDMFLHISIDFISSDDLFALISEFSEFIPNHAIGHEFYLKCLLNG